MEIIDRSLPDQRDPLGLTFAQRAHSDLNFLMQTPGPDALVSERGPERPITWEDMEALADKIERARGVTE